MRNSNIIILLLLTALLSCINKPNKVETNNYNQAESTNKEKNLSDREAKVEKETWEIKRIVGKQILFENGDTLKTSLNDLEYLGQFSFKNETPYLLLSGVDCDNCDADYSLYVHSPKDGDLLVKNGESSYSLAGKMFDFLGESLIYESRVFYGEVLPDTFGVIWIQKSLQENNTYEESSYLFYPMDTSIWRGFMSGENEKILERVELQKRNGLCKELPGKERNSAP